MAAAIVFSGITTTGVDAVELSIYSDSNIPHQNQHVVVHATDDYFTIFARTYNAN